MDFFGIAINLSGLLFLSALFSGAETAFTSISLSRAEVLRREKNSLSRTTVFLYDRLDMVIILNLIISNLVNIVISAYITIIATSMFDGAQAFTYAVSTGTILILVFGEILPKKIAILFPVQFSKFAAYILYFLYYTLYPIVIPISHGMHFFDRWVKKKNGKSEISEEEVGAMLDLGKRDGALESKEHEMIQNILILNDKEVRDIMVRRDQIIAMQEDSTVQEFLEVSAANKHSRIPIYKEEINDIRWILSIPQLTPFLTDPKNLNKKIKDFCTQQAFKIPQSKILDDLFFEFQKKRVHQAIVVDEFGNTSGLVTLEDIVEEIFGEIQDETDHVEVRIIETAGNIFADGETSLNELLKFLKISKRNIEQEVSFDQSISGLIIDTLHRFPKEGELVPLPGFPFVTIIADMDDNNRIDKVQILPNKKDETKGN